jgi:DNA mismatch repair protein MutS
LAGLPASVIARARSILAQLESEHLAGVEPPRAVSPAATDQLALFTAAPNPVIEELTRMDTNAMTPLDALTALAQLVERAKRL